MTVRIRAIGKVMLMVAAKSDLLSLCSLLVTFTCTVMWSNC